MESNTEIKKIRFYLMFLGVLQFTVGCVVGMLPPDKVSWYRGIVMAHLEFTANGVLLIVMGFLVREMQLSKKLFWLWFLLLQAGTWLNGTAGLVAGLTGSSSMQTPYANTVSPPPAGTGNQFVFAALAGCAITILGALVITLIGLWRKYKLERTTNPTN